MSITHKPDKYPWIDPMQPNVFDAILRAVNELRKRNKSESWRLEQQRVETAERRRRQAMEVERLANEARRLSAERSANRKEPEYEPVIQYRDENGTLRLKESEMPKFVR